MKVNKVYRLVLVALVLLLSNKSFSQEGLLLGGGLSYQIPTNNFGNDDFGFKDVANSGLGVNFNTLWFYNPRLSIASELGYSYLPKNEVTWNQEDRGNIKVNYQMVNLNAQGNFYFSEDKVRPYLGALFGLYYLRNLVDFDSNYAGTDGDASVNYISKSLHAGYGLESGFLFELSKTTWAQVSIRYTFIPNVEKEDVVNGVTKNPHGKQNHWGITAKLFFGKR